MKLSLKYGFVAALAAAVLTFAGAEHASAQMAGDAIKAREALMKDNSSNAKAIAAFVKKGMGTAADVEKHARHIAANAAKIPDLFPKGTSMSDGVGKTRAKPEIWMEWAKFEAAAANLSKLAWNVSAAAIGGDKAAIGAALGNLGKNGCGGCHKTFRGPKQ